MKSYTLFIVFMRFSDNKAQAGELMSGHNQWIEKGFEDGVFHMVGSLHPNQGGAILVHGLDRTELENRLDQDPFVKENIVKAEIAEVTPSKVSDELSFLM